MTDAEAKRLREALRGLVKHVEDFWRHDDDCPWSDGPDGERVEGPETPCECANSPDDHLDACLAALASAREAGPRNPSVEPYYLPMDCPICGRHRMQWNGKVLSCEKCEASSENDEFDFECHTASAREAGARAMQQAVEYAMPRHECSDDQACTTCGWWKVIEILDPAKVAAEGPQKEAPRG